MSDKLYDLVITGADLASHEGREATSIAIKDGRFAKIGDVNVADAADHIDAKGLTVLPGVSECIFANPAMSIKKIYNRARWPR